MKNILFLFLAVCVLVGIVYLFQIHIAVDQRLFGKAIVESQLQ